MGQISALLKSDYFRIEILKIQRDGVCFIELKSDYFRIEIKIVHSLEGNDKIA